MRPFALLHACILLMPLLAPAARPARAQGTLAEVRSRGELVIATDPTYAPFESKKGEQIVGFDVDLAAEIGREMGVKVRWVPMEWSGVKGALSTKKVDAIMAGVTITEERKKENGFTRPYFLSGQAIARRKGDNRIRSEKDLLDKTVGVIQQTTGQFAVEKLGVPKERIHRFETQPDSLMDVRNGKSDAAVGDEPALRAMILEGYPELELLTPSFVRENVGIETRKEDVDLLGAINRALDAVIVDGRYKRIYEKWIGEPLTTSIIGGLDAAKDAGTPVPAQYLQAGGAAGGTGASPTPPPAAGGSAFTIRWDQLRDSLPLLLRGAQLTLWVTLLTLLLGAPAGLVVALCRLSALPPLRWLATAYVEVVRGTPLLMQIYVIYFVLPALHINFNPLMASVTALSVNAAAYISEIFRGGIESIDVGQMEAARSLGMDYPLAMRTVILPQTLRRVLPPLTNEAVALLKDSSLVSVVALSELMRVGKEIATTAGSPTTIYLGVALLYLCMTLPLTWLVRRLEVVWRPVSRAKA